MTTDPRDAEIARLTAALAESEAAAEGALMILAQTQAERDRWKKQSEDWQVRGWELGQECDRLTAERDAALAQVAAAFEAAASICADQFAAHMTAAICGDPDNSRTREAAAAMAERLLHRIRALTPADALAARDRRDAQMRAEGMRKAAGIVKEVTKTTWMAGGSFTINADPLADAILAAAGEEVGVTGERGLGV